MLEQKMKGVTADGVRSNIPKRATKTDYTPSYAVTHRPFAKQNAENALKFEGRRYLGRTAGGQDVWVNFVIERDSTKANATKTVKTWTTVPWETMYQDDFQLADKRVSFGTGLKASRDLSAYLKDRTNTHGAVSHRTLDYIQKVIDECPTTNPRRHEFYQLANMIFVGTMEDCNSASHKNRFMVNHLLSAWNLRANYE